MSENKQERMRQLLGSIEINGVEHDLWVLWGPRPTSRSSSRQPEGTWKCDPAEVRDSGPSLAWVRQGSAFHDDGINAVRIESLLGIGSQAGPLVMAPVFDGDKPDTVLSESDKHRFLDAAIRAVPVSAGRFEIKWVPNDPRVPF